MLCPKCGASNDEHSKFCLSCGGPLNEATPPQTPEQTTANTVPAYQPPTNPVPPYQPPAAPPAKAKKGKGCLIALIVVLVLAIAGAAVFFFVIKRGVDKVVDEINDLTTVAEQTTQQQTTPQGENTTVAGQPSQQEIIDILSGSDLDGWDGNWNNLTSEQKQALESYYAALGQDVYFGENGITFKDGDDTIQLGGQWPNSPLLKDVPKPAFGSIFSVSTSDDEVAVTFSGWNQEQLMDYISLIKAAGFTKNAEEMTIMGMSTYEANNDSVKIEVVQAMGYYAITVSKL